MNQRILHHYITAYKQNFQDFREKERYKWQAVQHFQNHWNPEVHDFAAMLEESLSKAGNLLVSGRYYPERVLFESAQAKPGLARQAMLDLFDEHQDLETRLRQFKETIGAIVEHENIGKQHYQDDRAILVYLTLCYPEDYFFYKYTMFKVFCAKTLHDYQPRKGKFANIAEYLQTCNTMRSIIQADKELVQLHRKHLQARDYLDGTLNILTQDFIFAVERYLPDFRDGAVIDDPVDLPTVNLIETPMAQDLSEPVSPERVPQISYRILRDTKKSRNVKLAYDFRCQICGETIQLHDRTYSEAHHIKPLGRDHSGPDHISNIISVCPNHHALLDYGALQLDQDDLIIDEAHQLNQEYIDYHNREIYKGSQTD